MESRESYRPEEIAKLIQAHLSVADALKDFEEIRKNATAIHQNSEREEQFYSRRINVTLRTRLDSMREELIKIYEEEIPENVRNALKLANLLPYHK